VKGTTKRWARSTRRAARRLLADPNLALLERGRRDRCWCGGTLAPFPHRRRYAVCTACGTYVNTAPPTAEALRGFYSFERYWHRKQKADLLPPIEERVALDAADGRVDRWTEIVRLHRPAAGDVIEIGCSHGLLLERLRDVGYRCIGVEVDRQTAAWTQTRTGIEVRSGLFPDVELPDCDVFLAFDVLEHASEPLALVQGAAELLRPGGIAVLQAPIEREKQDPPFGGRFDDAFDDIEHLFVFTNRAMGELAARSGLEVIDDTERLWLLGEIVVLRKPR
jgi:SAM-dependent methyltransferase